ncbi:FxSxx-COOH cyclophane-containing RiPP peptide [Dactylosporangium sp. CA-233914]|uniref:FxSxx-COOH cyclophane-containing RiPP peptide n=1 Tax=Dactylosporangium sp. CA-233914 TaxID=3239934 RepID=UPI003D902D55
MGDGSEPDNSDRLRATLTDLSGIPAPSLEGLDLRSIDLGALGDGVLAHTIRRVLGEIDEPHETVAGFNSSI